jgi:RNA-binding protein
MLTPQNRAKLKSIAATQKDLVYIGQNNLTDNVVEQIKLNLFAHELIKVKVQKGAEYSAMELAEMICDKVGCETVAVIGNKILLYKVTTKPKFTHLL